MRGRSHRVGRATRKRRQKRESTFHSVSLSHQPQYVSLMRFLHQRGFTSTLLQPALFSGTPLLSCFRFIGLRSSQLYSLGHPRRLRKTSFERSEGFLEGNAVVRRMRPFDPLCEGVFLTAEDVLKYTLYSSADTGRGLQTLQTIKPDERLISLPESCLLTTSTVLNSYLGQYIKSWKPRLSPLLALCVFLVCERQRGEASDWFPYIDVLPTSFTCPAFFSDGVVDVLPAAVKRRALEQREAVREMHSSNQDFFRTLQPVLSQPTGDVLTYEALRWAWCSVNTRTVFMSRPSNSFLSGPDDYALAPFLDLLNHRPDVQVKAGFNHQTKCYEIRSASGTPRYRQAFINYGSHDNQRLLLEYGFVAMSNPHSVVYVETDLLWDVLRGDKSLDQKIKFLKENHFLHNLTISCEGPSWRLMVALRLLSLPQTLYHLWRAVLLGQVVDGKTEARSNQIARTLCQRLLKDTQAALDTISHLLAQSEQPVREQLEAVRLLRQEERWILESCLPALEDSAHLHDEMSPGKANA